MARTIKTSFAAGELTAALAGRVDLAKYQVGAAVMRNFFVDYRGGASTRAGTEHCGLCRLNAGDPKPRLIPFVFNDSQAYVLELNAGRMRVLYRGAYVTETALTITALAFGTTAVATIPGHTYAPGDFIFVDGATGALRANGVSAVNGRTFYVGAVAGSDVTLFDYAPGGYAAVVPNGWTPYTASATASRVYEVSIPWAAAALFDLTYSQSADVLTVTHPDYPTYDIQRYGQVDWRVAQEVFGSTVVAPVPTAAAYNNDTAKAQYFHAYVVTVVDSNGRESNASVPATVVNQALNQSSTPVVANTISYVAQPGGFKYRIYKAQPVPDGLQGAGPYFYGLVGNTYDSTFTDVNFAPDYTVTPPLTRNPFADRGIAGVNVTAAGSGYLKPYIQITDSTGSGAIVSLQADASAGSAPHGKVTGGSVISKGAGYTAPSATVLDAAPLGSGLQLAFSGAWVAATGSGFVPAPGSITIANPGGNYHRGSYTTMIEARATTSPVGTNRLPIGVASVVNGRVTALSWSAAGVLPTPATGLSSTGGADTLTFTTVGTDTAASGATVALTLGGSANPACVGYLAQRRVFAGSRANPAGFNMSRPGQFNNFDVSDPVQDDDAISASLYAQEVNAISSLVQVTNGLIALTSGGAYLITGDGNGVVSPSTVKAPPQVFSGAQALQPLRIGDHVLYAQARGSAVRDLAFDFYQNNFTGQDVSVLSGHLLEGRKITQWTYAEEPLKLLWAVRDDGVLLSCTYLKEQQVYGWARHDTAGNVVSVCAIPEDRNDAVYVVVYRYYEGYGFRYAVERMADRLYGANPAAGIQAQPELAWCVDAGASYSLTTPASAITGGQLLSFGEISGATVIVGGTGYSVPYLEVRDLAGSGAVMGLFTTAGVITGAAVSAGGTGYSAPRANVKDSTGNGAIVSLSVVNRMLVNFEAAVFSSADVGKVLRVRGGYGVVLSCPSPTSLIVNMLRLPAFLPNMPGYVLPRAEAGEWSLTAPVSVIGGLDHLNGSTVQIVVDGSVQSPKAVIDGCIALDQPGVCVVAGIGFSAQLQTMDFEVGQVTVQGARKEITNVNLRVKDARGLQVGSWWNRMTEVKQRDLEPIGRATQFQHGGERLASVYAGAPASYMPQHYDDQLLNVEAAYDTPGVVCIQQSYPMPATVLAVVPDIEVGDTP